MHCPPWTAARWIELMSDEKNYNRHTIGLWAIQEKQAHWRSLLDLTPTGGRFEAFLGKKSGSNFSPTDTYLNEKSWRGGLTQDGQWGNSKNLLANPIFLFNFSRVIKTTPIHLSRNICFLIIWEDPQLYCNFKCRESFLKYSHK